MTPCRKLSIVIGTPAIVPVHFIRTLEFSFIARTVIFPSKFADETPVVESEDDTDPPDTPIIGYTYNNSGESIDIPKGVVLYLEETFVL